MRIIVALAILVKLLGCSVSPDPCQGCRTDYLACEAGQWGCWMDYCVCLWAEGCEQCEATNDR